MIFKYNWLAFSEILLFCPKAFHSKTYNFSIPDNDNSKYLLNYFKLLHNQSLLIITFLL